MSFIQRLNKIKISIKNIEFMKIIIKNSLNTLLKQLN